MITTIRIMALGALLGVLVATAPVSAQTIPPRAPDSTFYETTENMRVTAKGRPRRLAQSALLGFANIDTPFCPGPTTRSLVANADQCTLNALGEDDISLVTGQGTFDAKLTIVVQEPGSVDSPEFVVGKRRASGRMDFAPAILNGIPYGTITGRVHRPGVDEDNPPRFFGVFRLPFACGDAYCYLGLDTTTGTITTGTVQPLQPHEFAIGFPAVRFDLWFH